MTMSGTLDILEELRKQYPGKFVMPKGVKSEVIDRPMKTHKYKFESIRVMPYIAKGVIEVIDTPEISEKAEEILSIANTIYYARGKPIEIVHLGEAEAIAVCLIHQMKTLVIDERTTRYLIEAPQRILNRLERKLHTRVKVDKEQLKNLNAQIKDIQPIRSIELLTIAFKKGLLKNYEYSNILKKPDFKADILEGILWALKLNGCAVLEEEIVEIQKLALPKKK
jgi:hypothetical protein